MRIGLYVGSFNPPHIGHLNVVKTSIDKMWLDEVVIMPTENLHIKDQTDLASAADRYAMCVRCFEENLYNVKVSNEELKRNSPLHTIADIRMYCTTKLEDKLFLIVGSDSFYQLQGWEKTEDIIKLVPIIVVARSGYDATDYMRAKYDLQKKTGLEVNSVYIPSTGVETTTFEEDSYKDNVFASSSIRKRIKENKQWRHLVPEGVAEYIKEKQLYV